MSSKNPLDLFAKEGQAPDEDHAGMLLGLMILGAIVAIIVFRYNLAALLL